MKKLSLYALSLVLMIASPLAFSSPTAKKKETDMEIKERLLHNVIKKDNGDILTKLPDLSNIKQVEAGYAPAVLILIMTYVDPDIDVEKFNKMMAKLKKPKIGEVTETASDFLEEKGMRLKDMKYSQGTIQKLIDNGLPLYAYIKNDKSAFAAIAKRTKDRPSEKAKLKDWKSELKDKTQKKINADSNEAFSAIILGFNKDTREYLVLSGTYGFTWVLESELKSGLIQLYQLKY